MNAVSVAPPSPSAPLGLPEPGSLGATAPQGWTGNLSLNYRLVNGRTVAHDRHDGPLRVLKALYPEGHLTCEHVLVHPPGGLVGGDELRVRAHLGAGTRVRLTTPGATRFYRSLGGAAVQRLELQVDERARLEWLPMETLAYDRCKAVNECRIRLAPGAEMIGWDLCCLGLPASGDAFQEGELLQHLEIEGVWLERGLLRADDRLLRESALGLDGQPVVAAVWCASGSPWPDAQRQALQQAAIKVMTGLSPAVSAGVPPPPMAGAPAAVHACGVTSPNAHVVVLRALAQRVEPVFELFKQVRGAWHETLWDTPPTWPRLWRM